MGDTVIIRHQRARDFTILDNAQVRDARLSWKARGLIAYLLSLSEGWQLRVSYLVKQAPDGRHSTRAGLAELQRFGYLVIERERGAHGRFERTTWTVIQAPARMSVEEQEKHPCQRKGRSTSGVVQATAPRSENRTLATDHHDPENRIVEKWTGTTEEPSVRRTTTTGSSELVAELVMPPALGSAEVVVVQGLVSALPAVLAQQVVDELAGAMARPGWIKASPIAFVRGLAGKAHRGDFHPSLGTQVAKARQQRAEQAKADARKRAERERRMRDTHSEASQRTGRAELAKLRKHLGMTPADEPYESPSGRASAAEGG